MKNNRLDLIVFSALFAGLSVLIFLVYQPFLYIIVLAMVLSVLFHPTYEKLTSFFHGGKGFFAALLVVVALVFLIIPLLFLGSQILHQAQGFFSMTQVGRGQYAQALQRNISDLVGHVVPGFSFNIQDLIKKVLAFVTDNLGILLSQTAYIFFQTFFLLFTFFFFLRDGKSMLKTFVSLSPFEKEQNKEIINSVYQTINSVIRGTIFVGLIRFILLALAFYLFGIPNALLWASIGGIIGAVPGLGTPFVIIPAILYFLINRNIVPAIGIGFFGVLLVFFIDNLLSAYFYGKGLDSPSIFVLFSILGGIIFFGPLGFIFGPIILSLFISAVDMYKILILKKN
ncbi:AI-2E family transporter [Candidatus Falkowbacteria bacterium]|nr:AI-2E family transporter [Candidatus Falkowbacteria bacterium]